MNKKIIAFMIAATLLFVGAFAACNKNEKNEDDEKPRFYIEGDEYRFFTDENGERALDENGEYIVYETKEGGKYKLDENGNRLTTNQRFEAYSEGNVIEDYGYKIEFPKGWSVGRKKGAFENEATGESLVISAGDITGYKKNYEIAKMMYEEASKQEGCKTSLETNIEGFGDEFEDIFRITIQTNEFFYTGYVFTNSGNLYCVVYQTEDSEATVENCNELMKCITFKPYQYIEPTTEIVTYTTSTTTGE